MSDFDPVDEGAQIHFGALQYNPLLVERLNRSIRATEIFFDEIRSYNYSAGTSGFAIFADGTADFTGGVVFSGDFYSSTWDGTTPANLATLDAGAAAGYYFDSSAGAAQLMGTLWMGGDIEMDQGAQIRTGPSGTNRLIIEHNDLTNQGQILFETTSEDTDGQISIAAHTIFIRPPYDAAEDYVSLSLISHATDPYVMIASDDIGDIMEVHGGAADPYVRLEHTLGSLDTQLLLEDGSAARPSLASDTAQTTGIYFGSSAGILQSVGGTKITQLWDNTGTITWDLDAVDVIIAKDGLLISLVGGSTVLTINDDGIAYENAATILPNRVAASPSDITSFGSTAETAVPGSTITLWTHGGTDRSVDVAVWGQGQYGEANAAAVSIGRLRCSISFDGGSTWSQGVQLFAYVGPGTGGGGYRVPMSPTYRATGTATGDVQARLDYKVDVTTMDRLERMHIHGVCEQVF